jgi:hypothetical protein
MSKVYVTALKSFTYRGTDISRGQPITMDAIEAAVSARRGEVSLSRGRYRRAALQAERAKTEAEKPKRRYRRRDLQAEE